ncbi:hypothetical protein CU320_01700 [Acinetobacter pseudolwoffii]|uniref:SGNH hydrolase-type esterase domain-containing protein n=2 Tax=Acinetobacter pseudolwoffii TaxID=2053287 RepID=A0A2H9UQV9_9GAMM|nr:hypothetical protein CU320_01700 [Acinetobacter pseudolwoffii]
MPLPTPEEMSDRTKTNAQMREMMAQMAEDVVSKNDVDANPLFKPKILQANSDLNSLDITGYFLVNAQASTIQNLPMNGNGYGFQSVDSLGNKTQWWINEPTNTFYYRAKWNGVWSPNWEKIEKSANLQKSKIRISSGTATTSNFTEQGFYAIAADVTITDIPADNPVGASEFLLEVTTPSEGSTTRIHRLIRTSGSLIGLSWIRRLTVDASGTATSIGAWSWGAVLGDGQIISSNLSKSFRYKGSYTAAEISAYLDDGLYTHIQATDRPAFASNTTGYVENINFSNDNFVFQKWITHNQPNEQAIRVVRGTQTPVGKGDWFPLGGSGASSHFAGKKIVCFGDSITEFGTYPQQIGTRLGASGYNVGFGGCRWAKHTNALYDPFSMYRVADYIATENLTGLMDAAIALRDSAQADDNTAAVTRLQSLDFSTVDYVTIFYGTNDFSGPNPIGTDSDTTGDTVKGAINLTLDKLLTKYPNLKIVLITPIWRARMLTGDGLESDSNPNSLGLYLRDYVEAIKDMGTKYHVPVLDLYNTSGINKYTKAQYISSDGLHLNAAGDTHLANLIAAKLSSTY